MRRKKPMAELKKEVGEKSGRGRGEGRRRRQKKQAGGLDRTNDLLDRTWSYWKGNLKTSEAEATDV